MTGQESRRLRGRPRNNEAVARSLATILNLVRTGQVKTRQEIERTAEMGRAVVVDRLAILTGLGLADETQLAAASGGRAPRLVRFDKDAGRVLAATLDQTAVGVALCDLSGALLTEHHEAFDLSLPAEETTGRLIALFEWLLERNPGSPPVWGIGISMPGPVQAMTETFTTSTPPLTDWDDYPFVETILRRFGAPVWLRSSVETMAMGELQTGGTQDMLLIKVGKRIGAGLVVGGRLHRGAGGTAGLIGQSPTDAEGKTIPLELLAGSDAIAEQGRRAAATGASDALAVILERTGAITAIDVGQAARMGDPASTEIMSRSGKMIGHVAATLANMLNPSLIVLSGSVAQTNEVILAAVREAVYGESHPLVTRDLNIVSSQLGNSASLVGAAFVAVEGLFDQDVLRSWIWHGTPLAHPEFREAMNKLGVPRSSAPESDELVPQTAARR